MTKENKETDSEALEKKVFVQTYKNDQWMEWNNFEEAVKEMTARRQEVPVNSSSFEVLEVTVQRRVIIGAEVIVQGQG